MTDNKNPTYFGFFGASCYSGLQPYSEDELIKEWIIRYSKEWVAVSDEEKLNFAQSLTFSRVRDCLMDKSCRNHLLLNSPITD